MNNGNRLANLRVAQGLSQNALAKLSGISQGLISAYERGEKKPGLETLQKVCPILGVSVADFLTPENVAHVAYADGTIAAPDPALLARLAKIRKITQAVQDLDDEGLNLIEVTLKVYQAQKK